MTDEKVSMGLETDLELEIELVREFEGVGAL